MTPELARLIAKHRSFVARKRAEREASETRRAEWVERQHLLSDEDKDEALAILTLIEEAGR